MNRRTLIQFTTIVLASPPWALAQTARRFRIGWLQQPTPEVARPRVAAFVAGMRERGYVLDEHYALDVRYADGDQGKFPSLAEELLALKPDILLGIQTTGLAMAAKTASVPIILTTSTDPVAAGMVRSLARPGTNVTGFVDNFDQLVAKHVELLLEIAPKASRLALLIDPLWSARESVEKHAHEAARSKKLGMSVHPVTDANALQQTFATLREARIDGLVIATGGRTTSLGREIVEGARQLRVPTISGVALFAERGGLASYGPDFVENSRLASEFVDRIVKGTKPADLPIRQTAKFEFVLNMKAAREIGVAIPQSILLRADRVIE